MKKMSAIIGLVLISSTVFAADVSDQCKSQVIARAATIKSKAKRQLRSTEDMMDAQLNKYGDPTVGMGTRGMDQGAQAILDAVRELQQDSKSELADVLKQLCNNKFNFEKTISE
jgi:hypothetical protein